ncbi:MAG: hypothetical protein V2A67_03905 [Bacteroidota bacterium]
MKKILILLVSANLMLLSGCKNQTEDGIRFYEGKSRWFFSNGMISVVFRPASGEYDVFRCTDRQKIISGACLKVETDSTSEPGRAAACALSDFIHGRDTGRYLTITSTKEGKPGLTLRFGLLPEQAYMVINGGVINSTGSAMQVHEINVITDGTLYSGKNLEPNFRMLDGNSGGEDTRVTKKSELDCRNNFLLTWGKPEKREVLVAGGLTYHEIEKFVSVEQAEQETEIRVTVPMGLRIVARLDAGKTEEVSQPPVAIRVAKGRPFRWDAGYGPEYDDILYDKSEVILAISGLKKGAEYTMELAWSDDGDTRVQSVGWSVGNGSLNNLLPSTKLPSHGDGDSPETIWLNLPAAASLADTLFIHFRNESGVNAVISDFRICEGHVKDNLNGVARPVNEDIARPGNLKLNLYAKDPVGKRVDPGQSWFPEDAFYLSVGHTNPFEAMEEYGRVLRDFQEIDLEYYTFPTVCLWYAQLGGYGGGPSINDAPGAVEEMDRAVISGFLRYSPVAIRLVPDAYEENNEQGWWDEKHWQMYGTGKYANPPDGNVDVAPGHYKKPYETTRKWAQAIIERGGIPLTYFQTGRRSEDYAAAHPDHMLFNRTDVNVPDDDFMIRGKGGYDFTDPGFVAHMEEVYRNLAEGGVQGLMYDYPYTAWAKYGGMEDMYSTTAAAFRTTFQLARTGLGPEAFLDQRNLDMGSDITLGIVSSQRIWGDTDRMSPLMITRGALRWYKNRQVVSYDMDAKNLLKAQPDNRDGIRKMLTLMYTTCGRFLSANSFDKLTPEVVHDLSRIFPYPDSWISARPVDAFTSKFPEIFVFNPDSGWYQLVVYNPDNEHSVTKKIDLNSPDYYGAAMLDPDQTYYAYEFWDDHLSAEFSGTETLTIDLRPGEAKMLSIREKNTYPQLLSTDRHLMQGMIETRGITWDPEKQTLRGEVNLVQDESMQMVFALNGYKSAALNIKEGVGSIRDQDDKILRTSWASDKPGWHIFALEFSKR